VTYARDVPDDVGSSDGPGRPATPEPATSTVSALDDQLLGGTRAWTMRQVAADLAVELDLVRRYWQTLGLPRADADDHVLTADDAVALGHVLELMRDHGLEMSTVITLTRALGHTADRLALWEVEALVEDMARRYELDDVSARLLVLDRLSELAPLLEAQLVYSWRRHLAAVAGRFAAEFAELRAPQTADRHALPLPRAVGFADMVSFTRVSAGLDYTDLSAFVQRFETAARDVVSAAGGRVVKTIGDAVLFVADDVATGADVALGLARAIGSEGITPPVRVSMVWGRVLSRFGDVFGPPVNLAARLADEARPSTVLVDETTADHLAGDPRYVLVRQQPREVQGLGAVAPVLLRWSRDADASTDQSGSGARS
jgi:adenylate cyclase